MSSSVIVSTENSAVACFPATMISVPVSPNENTSLISPATTPRERPPSPPTLVHSVNTTSFALGSSIITPNVVSRPVVASEDGSDGQPMIASNKKAGSGMRLNKFVRRLYDMLQSEKDSGVVEWRRGLLVLHSTDTFAKTILPKYFNTRNFKTFRRQLNYYGFVHVRSFSTTGSTTTALWVNRELANHGTDSIASVLMLRRVEPCESAKTAEGRRVRKELAVSTVEDDIGVSAKSIQMEQIRSLVQRQENHDRASGLAPQIPLIVHCQVPDLTVTTTPFLEGSSSGRDRRNSEMSELSEQNVEDDKTAANVLMMLSKAPLCA